MKIPYKWILAIFVSLLISSTASVHPSDGAISILSEGGCEIEQGDIAAAKDKAVQNALRKAIRSQVRQLVNLSKSESNRLMPDIYTRLNDYLLKYEVKEDTVQNDVVRVVLDIQIIPQKLVKRIIDGGFLSAFRYKPRILIALSSDQTILKTALEKGFVELGFHVIDGAERKMEIDNALESGNTDAVINIGKEVGSHLVITGEAVCVKLESKLIRLPSWRVEATLKTIKCDNAQILAAGNYAGAVPSMNELTGKTKASAKVALEVIRDFHRAIIEFWATGVALGEITISPVPDSGPPPQITVKSPSDGETVYEPAVRFVIAISDDQQVEAVRLSVNNTSLALDRELHLITEAYGLLINRLVPLKPGENVITVLALDQNNNRAEKELRVFLDTRIIQGSENVAENQDKAQEVPVRIKIESPLPAQRFSTEAVEITGEVLSSVPIQDQIDIILNGKGLPSSKTVEAVGRRPPGQDGFTRSFSKQVSLIPGGNRIEIIARTKDNQQFKENITVFCATNPNTQPERTADVGQKYAVIIGVSDYQDPDIRDLEFSRADAESIYEFVTDPRIGGFPKENVKLLMDEQATREAISETIGEWLPRQVESDDMVLLVYSGHGGVEADLTGEEPDGNSKYLIPHDARLGSLFSTAILNSTMTTMLERINSNQIVFLLDCCYSGGFGDTQGAIRSIASRTTRVQTDVYRDFSGSGRVVISASLPNQLSMELPELNHGLFTYNLLRGISGEADTNQDGFIALVCELYPFLHLAVGNMARDYGFMQEPMLKCQIAGDLILSKVHKAGLKHNEEGIKE